MPGFMRINMAAGNPCIYTYSFIYLPFVRCFLWGPEGMGVQGTYESPRNSREYSEES